MKLEEAKERVSDIRAIRRDDEVAHSREDSLYFDFVYAIADGTVSGLSAAEIAKEIIKTREIDFCRWCA